MLSHLLIARSAMANTGPDLAQHAQLNCSIVNLARRFSALSFRVVRSYRKLTRTDRPYAAIRGTQTLH